MIDVRWTGLESGSAETCSVMEVESGIRARSVVRGDFGECGYTLDADGRWRFRSLIVTVGGRSLRVERDGALWTVDGRARPDLAGASEVDIEVTPFTNTLPIRRLDLRIGDSADITTAYVTVPGLAVWPDPQRYTRLADREYRYESRDSDFVRTITVDADGLVVDYPGLFVRAAR